MTTVHSVRHLARLAFCLFVLFVKDVQSEEATCYFESGDCDTSLQAMAVDVGEGEEIFLAHVPPDVSSFYQEPKGSVKEKQLRFKGFSGKFINMSPDRLRLFWQGNDGKGVYIADANPFEAVGTATYPGHTFYFTPIHHPAHILITFVMETGKNLYVYDPFAKKPKEVEKLKPRHKEMYTIQKQNLIFAEYYKNFTKRDWLSLYGYQDRPIHKMWQADYFGQTYTVPTKETHFVSLPPQEKLTKVTLRRRLQDEDVAFKEHRTPGQDVLNMTMTVISCAPRAFEVKNFMSNVEVDHFLELASGMKLSLSTTRAANSGQARSETKTRSSHNTWVNREHTPVIDTIYRRAADLLQMDESLFRTRSADEHPELDSKVSIAERLQLVHYDKGQQYTPHHDFSYPAVGDKQPSRFATLLLYLNEGMTGGETSFPRWVNAETKEALLVKPEKGKAVLFYSVLPDGNYDDLSQHAALPVKHGEKWLTNLWVWDPYKD